MRKLATLAYAGGAVVWFALALHYAKKAETPIVCPAEAECEDCIPIDPNGPNRRSL